VFARHERSFGPIRGGRTVPKARVVAGVGLICVGLAATAGVTITSPDNPLGIRVTVVAAPFVGAALMGFGPIYDMIVRRRKKRGSVRRR
jgi:hypothetical protein